MAAKRKRVQLEWFGEDLVEAVKRAGEPALWSAGQRLKREAMNLAPVRTGAMRRSAFVKTRARTDYVKGRRDRRKLPSPSEQSVIVGFGAWYSNLLEDSGAKEHRIPRLGRTTRARQRKVLRINGRFAASVKHPGMRRRPFLSRAMERTKGSIAGEIVRGIGDAIERDMPNA